MDREAEAGRQLTEGAGTVPVGKDRKIEVTECKPGLLGLAVTAPL